MENNLRECASRAAATLRSAVRGLTRRRAALMLALAGATAAVAAVQAAQAQTTYPGKIGMGLSSAGGNALEFVDAMKTARAFEGATLDTSGWPTGDADCVVFDNRPFGAWNGPTGIDDPQAFHVDVSGVYHVSSPAKRP